MTADADSRAGFRCEECGAALVPQVFQGEDISALVGLRTVLLDDVLLDACPAQGHGTRIHKGEDIEKAIAVVAATLATQARLWTGEEARFVRLLLAGTRTALAALVDASPEEVLAWEEERAPLPRGTEIVIRARLRTLLREERSSLPLPFPALLDKERLPLAATPVFRVRPREVPGLPKR